MPNSVKRPVHRHPFVMAAMTAATLSLVALLATGCADTAPTTGPLAVSANLAKGSTNPPPATVADLNGSWTSTPKDSIPWFDGVSVHGFMRKWWVFSAQQNNTSIKGTGNGFVQYFKDDGSVYTGVLSTGGGIKFQGTINGFTDVTVSFDGNGESKVVSTGTYGISADGHTLTKIAGTTGFRGFTR